MERRHFITSIASLGAAACLPKVAFPHPPKPLYKMGLQLFSIHADMMRDAASTLAAIKRMGYEDLETFGFDGERGTFYGLPSADFKALLDELELSASSGHFGFSPYWDESDAALIRFLDQCIQGAHVLGLNYITWPWLDTHQRTLEHFKRLAERLNVIGERVRSAGLGFAYHNHGFEFVDHQGKSGFDVILGETDPKLVKLQMDMYWVVRASPRSPRELVNDQPGRYVMWHIKDMDKASGDYIELGNGSIDYADILPDPKEAGLEFYYLEQGGNYTHSPMISAATSAAYFKRHLQSLL